jgi:hypothetical protein
MKVHDSGMPDQAYWNSLFDIPRIVDWLNLKNVTAPIVEIGCGYGTFTVPIAGATDAEVHAFDIETPRGPGVHLRPDQRMILGSIKGPDVCFDDNGIILEPYHWGIQLIKRLKRSKEAK